MKPKATKAPASSPASAPIPGRELTRVLARIERAASMAANAPETNIASPDAHALSVLSASLRILHDVVLEAHQSGHQIGVGSNHGRALVLVAHDKERPDDARERAIRHIERLTIMLGVEADAEAEATSQSRHTFRFYAGVLGRLSQMARSVPEGHTLASEGTPRDGLRFFYEKTRQPAVKPRPELRLLQGGLATEGRAS